MAGRHIDIYLNDHLNGANAAIELLEGLQATYHDRPISDCLAGLHGDLLWERSQIELLMQGLDITAVAPRRWAAWLSEKLSELRMALDDRSGGDFRLFEGLEALSVGIAGKRLLWRALAAIARETPLPVELDYPRLSRMAIDQRRAIERFRQEAARLSLLTDLDELAA